MKILVTGATGKVGSRLAKRLARGAYQVRALVRDPDRAAELRDAQAELTKGDLLDKDSLAAAVRGIDAVVHCAAFFPRGYPGASAGGQRWGHPASGHGGPRGLGQALRFYQHRPGVRLQRRPRRPRGRRLLTRGSVSHE